MSNKPIISPQIINTLAISHDPWGIKDNNSWIRILSATP